MLDIIKVDLREYKNIVHILMPTFLFIIYLILKFNIKLFSLNNLNAIDGILLIIFCLYLGIFFQVLYLLFASLRVVKIFKSSNTPSDASSNTSSNVSSNSPSKLSLSFSFYSTSCMVFFSIFLIEIAVILINKIDEIGIFNITDIFNWVKPYCIIGISLLMFLLMKELANIYGEK